MTYSAFISSILSNIEEQENSRTYISSEYVVHFEYEPKKDSVWIMGVNDQLFSSCGTRCIEVCHRSFSEKTGEDIIEWFSDWCEFDVSDYVFTLHGVYNTEFLLNLFEELTGIQNHTIEVKAGD
jgi:hypothetical protein